MDESRRVVAVMWLSAHLDEPLDTLKNRVYTHEDEWDWNIGQTPTDPIIGIPMIWDSKRGCYVPFHEKRLEDLE